MIGKLIQQPETEVFWMVDYSLDDVQMLRYDTCRLFIGWLFSISTLGFHAFLLHRFMDTLLQQTNDTTNAARTIKKFRHTVVTFKILIKVRKMVVAAVVAI